MLLSSFIEEFLLLFCCCNISICLFLICFISLFILSIFLMCLKQVHNCSLEPIYDGCFKIFIRWFQHLCLLSVDIQADIFLVLGMTSEFWLYSGHFWDYIFRLWILFESPAYQVSSDAVPTGQGGMAWPRRGSLGSPWGLHWHHEGGGSLPPGR